GLSVASPVGVGAPDPTGPEFNVFVLLPASSGGIPTATRTPSKTPTPSGPTHTPTRTPTKTPTAGGGGGSLTLVFSAESGALVAPMTIYNSSNAFGGKYIASPAAGTGTATWTVDVPTSGQYVLWCRVYAGSTNSNAAYFRVDSGTEDTFDIDVSTNWK